VSSSADLRRALTRIDFVDPSIDYYGYSNFLIAYCLKGAYDSGCFPSARAGPSSASFTVTSWSTEALAVSAVCSFAETYSKHAAG
jgi:hypothetical protein